MLQLKRSYSVLNKVKGIFGIKTPVKDTTHDTIDEISQEEVKNFKPEDLMEASIVDTVLGNETGSSLDRPININEFTESFSIEFKNELASSNLLKRSGMFLPVQGKALTKYLEMFYHSQRPLKLFVQSSANNGKSSLGVIVSALECFFQHTDHPGTSPKIVVYSPSVDTLCYYEYHLSSWPSSRPLLIEKDLKPLEYDIPTYILSENDTVPQIEEEEYDIGTQFIEKGEMVRVEKQIVINEDKFKDLTVPKPQYPYFRKKKVKKAEMEKMKKLSESMEQQEMKKEEDITHQYEEEDIYPFEPSATVKDIVVTNKIESIDPNASLVIFDDLESSELPHVRRVLENLKGKALLMNSGDLNVEQVSELLGEFENCVKIEKEEPIEDKIINQKHCLVNFDPVEAPVKEVSSSVLITCDADGSNLVSNEVHFYEKGNLLELLTRKLVKDVLVRDLFQTVIFCPNPELVEMVYRYLSSLLLATDTEVIALHHYDTSNNQYDLLLESFRNVLSSRIFITSDEHKFINLGFTHVIHIGVPESKVAWRIKTSKPKINGYFSKRTNNVSFFITRDEEAKYRELSESDLVLSSLPELTEEQNLRVNTAFGIFSKSSNLALWNSYLK